MGKDRKELTERKVIVGLSRVEEPQKKWLLNCFWVKPLKKKENMNQHEKPL